MHSEHKNSYLQSRTYGVNPRIINRCVDLARDRLTTDGGDFEPPWNRLTSEQPCIPEYAKQLDVIHRPIAFGRWALPKLRRELHNPDESVALKAILSIEELVHNPEKGYEAIRLRIPDRMVDLLARENEAMREGVCAALTVIAGLSDGRDAIVKNQQMLSMLIKVAEDASDAVRIKAALLLEMIARFWIAADELVYAGFVALLLDNLTDEEEILAIHLETLEHLMYAEGKNIALDYGAFDIFVDLMFSDNPKIVGGACECLRMVTSTLTGQEMAYNDKILITLNRLLHYEVEEIYTAAASAIMFCTVLTKAKIQARKIDKLPDRLIALCGNTFRIDTQIYCIKALTNICEHPVVRNYVKENYLEIIKQIPVSHSEDLKRYKDTLLSIVDWRPMCAN